MNREELVELFDKYSDLINMGTSEYSPEVTGSMLPKKHYQ